MEILNSPEILISLSLALGLVIGMIVLLVLQARNNNRVNQLTFPAYEFTIKKAQNTADEILGEARKQAREIVASAEVQSRQIIQDHTEETGKLRESYLRSLADMKQQFNEEVLSLTKNTQNYSSELARLFATSLETQESDMKSKLIALSSELEGLPERLVAETQTVSSELQDRVARAGEEIERALEGVQEESRRQISAHLMKKFTDAEADIESYRASRERILDRHLTTLIKDVVRVTLQKELTADDHAELVRQALSEAREGSLI